MNTRMTNKASWYARQHPLQAAGTPEHLGGYIKSNTVAFNDNNPSADTVTDSNSAFLAKGFEVGDVITISGASTAANNGTFVIDSVTAGTITLTSVGELATEAASATITITVIARARNQEIDDGIVATLRAHPDNTGTIYLANTSANAADSDRVFTTPLDNDQAINIQVTHLSGVWMDADNSGDKVIISYEM